MSLDNNKAAAVWIAFKDGVSDEDIRDAMDAFYRRNEGIIAGMEFNQIDTVDNLRKGKHAAKAVWHGDIHVEEVRSP